MNRPVFVALDVANLNEADRIIDLVDNPNLTVKIGMELFYHYGPSCVHHLKGKVNTVFLDLKLFDIPNTVKKGMHELAGIGVDYVTVNSLGGAKMIQAAKEGLTDGAKESGNPVPKLLAVTELTSLTSDELKNEQNCSLEMSEQVVSLARLAKNAGADGVITSPLEVAKLKERVGDDFLYVTPGIRLKENSLDDQSRIATPADARRNGSTGLVVGRPITKSRNPKDAYQKIMKEWNYEG